MSQSGHAARPLPDWSPRPVLGSQPLVGRRVRLERLAAAKHGAALFAENAGDVAMWDYMAYGPFAAEADYLAWVRSVESGEDPMYFAILDATGRPRGVASYLRCDRANGVVEVGNIALSPGLQRSAEASEAMYLLAEHAFASGYRRYEWKCNAANLSSRRAAERYGFSYEGTFRNHMVIKGRNRDTAWFAMTDEDWPALQAAHLSWLEAGNFDAQGRQKVPLSALTRPLLKSRDPGLV